MKNRNAKYIRDTKKCFHIGDILDENNVGYDLEKGTKEYYCNKCQKLKAVFRVEVEE